MNLQKKGGFLLLIFFVIWSIPVEAEYFSYASPGDLIPQSGVGKVDFTVHAPGIRFPVEFGPVYANSQVWRPGGYRYGGGSPSDPSNFKYPWQDNFCETRGRDWSTPECPNQDGGHHQGQDNRPPTYVDKTYWAVATADGTISYGANDYVVTLTTPGNSSDSITYRYMHLDPSSIVVANNAVVRKGDRIGKISNWFGGELTTIHLHFDIQKFVPSIGRTTWVSPYMSLVRSYESLIGYQGYTINTSVKVTGIGTGFLPVYGSSACGSVIGYRGETSVAVVLDGPVTCGGEVRWRVRFTDCLEGWVSGEWLKATNCLGALVNPRDGASVSFPAQFTSGWSGDCRNATLAFSNGQQEVGFPIPSFYDQTISENYWNQSIVPVIGNGPTYNWSVGENFCGSFFPRTSWQNFQKVSSCVSLAARSGGFARAANQCGGATPTSTPIPAMTFTPTRTWTPLPGGYSPTPVPSLTQIRTPTNTPFPTPPPTATSLPGTPTPTAGSLIFVDNFNRPDSTVAGNGWSNVHPSIFVQGNRLVGSGIITRDLPFNFPIRIRGRLIGGGCGTAGGVSDHFDHELKLFTDQYGSGGYGLYFFRPDETQFNSQIALLDGNIITDRVYSFPQFANGVDIDFSVFSDGSVRGVAGSQGIDFPFVFPAREMQKRGNFFMLRLHWNCPERFLAWDDLVVEAVALPTPSPAWSSVATMTATWTSVMTPTSTSLPTMTPTVSFLPTVTPTMVKGDCCTVHDSPGCNVPSCEDWVNSVINPGGTSICFQVDALNPDWRVSCVNAAFRNPQACPCAPTFAPTATTTSTRTPTETPGGGCYQVHVGSGCDDEECEVKVCEADFSCCGGGSSPRGWDQSCVNAANFFCRPTSTPTATATASVTATATATVTLTPIILPTPTATEISLEIPLCSFEPLVHCMVFDQASLRIRETRVGMKTLWRGSRYGEGESQSLGNPLSSTNYAICLYQGESTSLALGGTVEAGQGWRLQGSGFSYSSDLNQMKLRISLSHHVLSDHFLVRLRDREDRVEIDSVTPLIFQIQNSEGRCWSSTFQPPFRTSGSSKTSALCETRTSPCSP